MAIPTLPDYVGDGDDASSDAYNELVALVLYLANRAPRGPVASPVSSSASSSTTTTAVADAGLSITYTVEAGRRYECVVVSGWGSSVAGDVIRVYITDGSNNIVNDVNGVPMAADVVAVSSLGTSDTHEWPFEETPASGSTTRKVRFVRANGTGNVQRLASASVPSTFKIRDVGAA